MLKGVVTEHGLLLTAPLVSNPMMPAMLATLTTTAPADMWRSSARKQWKTPVRLAASTACHVSESMSPMVRKCGASRAAQLTAPSRRLNRSTVVCIHA